MSGQICMCPWVEDSFGLACPLQSIVLFGGESQTPGGGAGSQSQGWLLARK